MAVSWPRFPEPRWERARLTFISLALFLASTTADRKLDEYSTLTMYKLLERAKELGIDVSACYDEERPTPTIYR